MKISVGVKKYYSYVICVTPCDGLYSRFSMLFLPLDIPKYSSTACKKFPRFLSSVRLVACCNSVRVTFSFTVTHFMSTNCCLYPLCFRKYFKAPEWHSAYQNTGKSPPPGAAGPFPDSRTPGCVPKKRSFLIKASRFFRFIYVPRK